MKTTVRGVRSVEIEMGEPERAAEFYAQIWNLKVVERKGRSVWLRGTGAYHHILAIHPAKGPAAMRRLTFDAANRAILHALHNKVAASGCATEAPHEIDAPGGGYGFGFADGEGRNLAVVCDVRDHADAADVPDRPRKIAHVNLNAAQLENSNAFLIDVLGFRKVDHSGPL